MNIREAENLLSLTDREKRLIIKHKLDFEQILWMRYTIKNKCGGNIETFEQQYPLVVDDAFLISGKCRFNTVSLKKIKNTTTTEGICGYFDDIHGKMAFRHDPQGWWRIFKHPGREGTFVAGADVAEGGTIEGKVFGAKDSTDYSTCEILDAKTCEQVAELQCRLEPNVFAEELRRGCVYYHDPLLAVERNSQGLSVLYPLRDGKGEDRKDRYSNLFYMENFDKTTQVRHKKLGWLTTKTSKPDIISVLDQYIREENITIHSPYLLSELMTFVRFADGTVGAMSGTHDDLCLAIAIALRMIRHVIWDKKTVNATQAAINAAYNRQMKGVTGY